MIQDESRWYKMNQDDTRWIKSGVWNDAPGNRICIHWGCFSKVEAMLPGQGNHFQLLSSFQIMRCPWLMGWDRLMWGSHFGQGSKRTFLDSRPRGRIGNTGGPWSNFGATWNGFQCGTWKAGGYSYLNCQICGMSLPLGMSMADHLKADLCFAWHFLRESRCGVLMVFTLLGSFVTKLSDVFAWCINIHVYIYKHI